MMKRILALMLALLTVATLSACGDDETDESGDLSSFKEEEVVFASLTNDYGIFHFEMQDSDSVVITKYEGSTNLHEVVIPSTVQTGEDAATTTKTVVAIGESAFQHASAITKLTIPEGVTTIGKYAFAGCVQMKEVLFPSTIVEIGMGAFYECGIETLALPTACGLTSISDSAFALCKQLTKVTIPAYIKTIGYGAFQNCEKLSEIVLAEGVETVGKQAFQGTVALEKLTLPATFTNTDPIEDLAFSGSKVLYRENITCPAGSAAEAYANKMVLSSAPEVEG